jgi:hypothetical protein
LEIWKTRLKIWWVCSVYFGGEFSNCGDKKIGKFFFFLVYIRKKIASKLGKNGKTCPNQKFRGEKKKNLEI